MLWDTGISYYFRLNTGSSQFSIPDAYGNYLNEKNYNSAAENWVTETNLVICP